MVSAESDGRPMIALVAGGSAKAEADVNLAFEPRDTLTWSGAPVLAAAPAGEALPLNALSLSGALARSAQMAGGLEFLLAQSVKYVTERVQFGRPLASFQAIQHQLALLAGHTAAAGMAAQRAFASMDAGDAAFRIRRQAPTGEAAGLGAASRTRSRRHRLHVETRFTSHAAALVVAGEFGARRIGQPPSAARSRRAAPTPSGPTSPPGRVGNGFLENASLSLGEGEGRVRVGA